MSTLYYLRRRLRIVLAQPQRTLNKKEVARLVAMAKAGATQVQIANALGVTQSAVSRRFATLGIEGRRGRRRRTPRS